MSLPSNQPLPNDESSSLPPARRRRKRRMVIPTDASQRAAFVEELGQRVTPSADFFLFALAAGVVVAAAIHLDSAALYMLAALVSPFMAPVVGLSLGVIAGSPRFFLRSMGGMAVAALLVFAGGALGGWMVNLWPVEQFFQASLHALFTIPDFLVLTIGAGLTTYLTVRIPKSKALAASVAVAYELFLPVAVAGFGLTSGLPNLFPDGLIVFAVHLAWAVIVGALVLAALGMRLTNVFGYTLSASLLLVGILTVVLLSGVGTAIVARVALPTPLPSQTPTATISPTPSRTPPPPTATLTPTNTLVPPRTPTMTISPIPTPVWARIAAEGADGATIRTEADYEADTLITMINGMMVEVLPDVKQADGVTWVHVRLEDGREGWIVRGLLKTATPAPGW